MRRNPNEGPQREPKLLPYKACRRSGRKGNETSNLTQSRLLHGVASNKAPAVPRQKTTPLSLPSSTAPRAGARFLGLEFAGLKGNTTEDVHPFPNTRQPRSPYRSRVRKKRKVVSFLEKYSLKKQDFFAWGQKSTCRHPGLNRGPHPCKGSVITN